MTEKSHVCDYAAFKKPYVINARISLTYPFKKSEDTLKCVSHPKITAWLQKRSTKF